MKNKKMLQKIIIVATLISLSVVLSLFDRLISTQIIGLIGFIFPSFRIGIANVVILVIILNYNFKTSLLAIVLKSVILGLFNSGGFIMGFSGTLLSFLAMWVLSRILKKTKDTIIISAVGGFTHSFGQLLSGFLLYGLIGRNSEIDSFQILIYAPILLIVGILTGILIGIIVIKVNKILLHQHIIYQDEKSEDKNE